ncbi:TetR/AcrR family transcriptional regulator [Acidimangrovimonas sediminis]|uniref:TetR/AcrR family transcriptional regulator n=1 Tax=Acidimangrovimonas sediminis TaxID=2056283 RepID=UPI000C7FFD81|nr:TetR/AcrR family transcriptional regulator [Acidimangrovimonas sediminis]
MEETVEDSGTAPGRAHGEGAEAGPSPAEGSATHGPRPQATRPHAGRPHGGGRPRDAEAGDALKAAALRLVRERGYARVTTAEIARSAGVARQTLYNRWNSKADLVLDAVFEAAVRSDLAVAGPDPLRDDFPARLRRFLEGVFTRIAGDGDSLRSLIAAAQDAPEFRAALHERLVAPREAIVTALLREAQVAGQLAPRRDPVMLSRMIHGAFWYALLNGQPLDAELARAITAEVFPA